MVPNEEKGGWHYLAIKKLSAFLRETSSKNKLIEIFIKDTLKVFDDFQNK